MFYFNLVISCLNQGHKFISLWLLRATLGLNKVLGLGLGLLLLLLLLLLLFIRMSFLVFLFIFVSILL